MKPYKLIFQCPYYYTCNRDEKPFPYYADNVTYEKRGFKCMHPFLSFRNEEICMLAYYEDEFDYDKAVQRIHVHWKVKARRFLKVFKRGKK